MRTEIINVPYGVPRVLKSEGMFFAVPSNEHKQLNIIPLDFNYPFKRLPPVSVNFPALRIQQLIFITKISRLIHLAKEINR